jgi:formylglycine-generating enzyme required for sulfatase activity
MTQGARWRRRCWSALAAIAVTGWVVCLSLVEAAAPVKELDPVRMVTIEAGEFLMGNPEGVGRADEWPQRPVYLDTFAIDQVEVTNERYMAFVATTGHRNPPNPYGTGPLLSAEGIEQLPVVQVTWYDAKAYCSWAKKRLPTEAEWEKAARGTDGRKFPWGNDSATVKRANFDREWEEDKTLHPVGTLPGGDSPYGVKDLSGNAREWVQDWYDADYYKHGPDRNPRGPEKGIVRSIRGGSWHSPMSDITTSARGRGGFALQTHGTGFRCARSLEGEAQQK